nr:DUF2461 domain-containing protein [Maliibacterium massiliense]
MAQHFQGFSPETLDFLMAIAFNNDRSFFLENHAQYERAVLRPMQALAADLAPYALEVDEEIDTRATRVVSRIRRDTRFSHDKSPYRDHMWLSFRKTGTGIGETCSFYFSIYPESYDWGLGFYNATPAQQGAIRRHIASRPGVFAQIVEDPAFAAHYTLHGNDYKRLPHECAGAQGVLLEWMKKKSFFVEHERPAEARLFTPQLLGDVLEGFRLATPLYRFVQEALLKLPEEERYGRPAVARW